MTTGIAEATVRLIGRKLGAMEFVATHYVGSTFQVHRDVFEDGKDKDRRQTRRILADLLAERLVGKCRMEVVEAHGLTAPLWHPTRLGLEALAQTTGEPR